MKPYVRRRRAPPGEGRNWVDPAVAAAAFGVSPRTIRRRCGRGELRCVNINGWMVARDELPAPVEPDRG